MNRMAKGMNPPHVEDSAETARLDGLAVKAAAALRGGIALDKALKPDELTLLRLRYGHFEDTRDGEGFLTDSINVITKAGTPRPWIHFLTSRHDRESGLYGTLWDQTGGGFSCYESVFAGTMTSNGDKSYVPTSPRADDQRFFWLREETDSGAAIWHAFPLQGREEELYGSYRCEQGTASLAISSERNRIASRLEVFVPLEETLEAWRLTLTNTGGSPRKLSLFVQVNWGLESYPGHAFVQQVVSEGVVFPELNALLALNNDRNNLLPRSGWLMSDRPFESFDLSGEDFTGGGRHRLFPRAVSEGRCRNSTGYQPWMGLISAMQFSLEIPAGKSQEVALLLGASGNDREAARGELTALRGRFFAPGAWQTRLNEVRERTASLVQRQMALTPDMELDRFYNIWSRLQNHSQSRFMLGNPKVGVRDILQYLLGICSFNPEFAAVMLPAVLRHQYSDGGAMRGFDKIAGGTHDLRRYMDNCSWIPDALVTYVKETGDTDFLEREEGFFDPSSGRVESAPSATIYEHARRAVKMLYENRGLHDLCLIGHGDWNDALDGVGRDGRGVSVWLSMALVWAARRFRELARFRGDADSLRLMDQVIADVTGSINRNAWDGSHYIYAFPSDGRPVGASSCEEGRLHLNVNAWALFNGVAEAGGRVRALLEALEAVNTPLGSILIDPPYTARSRAQVGRIADQVPGQFENGAIYTHGQSFLTFGLACLGEGDRAWAELKKLLPSSTLPDISTGPPHEMSNYTVGPTHPYFGRNLFNNFTGSIGWLRRTVERMYGVLADFDSLLIDPVIPSGWDRLTVRKEFRGCRVTVAIRNPDSVQRGVVSARLDGAELPLEGKSARLPLELVAGRKEASCEVLLGK